MIKKIVHVSDLHIKTYQLHEMYEEQFNKFLKDLKEKISSWENITKDEIRIVVTGDIAHQKITISNEQLLLTSWFLRELAKQGKVVIIPGNHDFLENNMMRVDSITPVIQLIENGDITYYKDSGVYEDENIDWVVYSLYQHNRRPEFESDSDGNKKVGLFHGPIQGLSTDTGYTFEENGYDRLNFKDLDLVLCGDVHKRSVFQIPGGGKGVMIGSLIQQNFGETVKHHGYGIYDVETDDYTFHDIENKQPYLHFKMTDISDIENEKEVLLNLG